MKKYYFLLVVLMGFGSVSGQNIVFADAVFKGKLVESNESNYIAKNFNNEYFKIDSNNNGEIEFAEALLVKDLSIVNANGIMTNIIGIEHFTNIKTINVNSNDLTGTLDVSMLTNLTALLCASNDLSYINVSNLVNLITLIFDNNAVNTIDLSDLTSLRILSCMSNGMSALDVSTNTELKNIDCRSNGFTTLNLSGLSKLTDLECSSNFILTELYLTGCVKLHTITFRETGLINLDLTYSPDLSFIHAGFTPDLQSIFIKGRPNVTFSLYNAPNLVYLCVDESRLTYAQNQVTQYGYNCVVNSYCSFQSGSAIYNIEGYSTYDSGNNGCNFGNTVLPHFKYTISDVLASSTLIANETGNYNIAVSGGTHTITPVLENPTFFNVLPTSASVTFPATESPSTQNFCITPNGIHPDLEITILSTTPARPGFDSDYKIVIKNKGNTQQSGTAYFAYDDAVLDYVSANPLATTQTTGVMTWDFANLQPFETREISLTLNVNSPMEIPAVNGGDVLNYTATITSAATDDMPLDNTFSLPQTVVNSFDPNDKNCLEGTEITPDMIGKYVHYMISFENTGTFPAQNIVVKDIIDLSKFDISSLIPLSGSHDYVTRISGNKVEFIFEGINLPFQDATNDGYIVFKIKTLPTLVLGDSFSNSASIYFDYNFPIVTDPAVTTFAVLGTQDFVFNNYLTVYPNPTNTILNITAKQSIELKSMEVYNMLGQLVLSVPNATGVSSVDVSNLTTGTYFLKVVSDKGTSNVKFIKN